MLKYIALGCVTTACTLTLLNKTKSTMSIPKKLEVCALVYVSTLGVIAFVSIPYGINSTSSSVVDLFNMAK